MKTDTLTRTACTKTTQAELRRHALRHGLGLIDSVWQKTAAEVAERITDMGLSAEDPKWTRDECRARSFGIERKTDRGWSRLELGGASVYRHPAGFWLVCFEHDSPTYGPTGNVVVYA